MPHNTKPYFAGLVTGACLAAFSLAAIPSNADEAQPAAGADVAAQLASLEERVKVLESEKDKPVSVPFTIVNAAGKEIFKVTDDGAGPSVHVTGPSSSITMEAAAETRVLVGTSAKGVQLGMLSNGIGVMALENGKAVAELTDRNNGKYALRIAAPGGGPTLFQAGYHQSGQPVISLWDGDKPIVRIERKEDSNGGKLTLFGGDKTVELGASPERSGLFIKQADTSLAEVSDRDNNGKFAFRIAQPGSNDTLLQAGFHASGRVGISVWEGANPIAFLERAEAGGGVLNVYNKEGKPALSAGLDTESGKPVLMVGEETAARIRAGQTKDGAGAFVSLIDQAGKERAALTADTERSAIDLTDAQGKPMFSVDRATTTGKPQLVIGDPSGPHVQTGVHGTADGSYLSLIDQSGKERAVLTGASTQAQLALSDNSMRADLGTQDDTAKQPGLFLGKGDADSIVVRLDAAGGGTVRVAGPAGKIVAGLLADEDGGGRVVVTGPDGGMSLVSLGGYPLGGKITLWDAAGEPRVDLKATDQANIQLTAKTGTLALTTGEMAPSMRLSLGAADEPVVFVGATTSGVGIVKTGPGGNGPAGTLGAGLQVASQIQGRND